MSDFLIRRWDLDPYPDDQAPPHVHHQSDEAFCVLRGQLEVLVGEHRQTLAEGDYLVIPAGTIHTFRTVGETGTQVLAVMTPEIDALIGALHSASSEEERAAAWSRHNSSPVDLPHAAGWATNM